MHDLDPIARVQRVRLVAPARHDGAVHFHRDPAPGQALGLQQRRQGDARRDRARLSVEDDIHGADCRIGGGLPQRSVNAEPRRRTI